MKVIAMSREAHAPAAVVRAARLLERFEVKQLLAATPLRDSCLSGPARLLDAIREWRQFFDAPKMRRRRAKRMSLRQFKKAVTTLAKHDVQKTWMVATASGVNPSPAATTKARSSRAAKLPRPAPARRR